VVDGAGRGVLCGLCDRIREERDILLEAEHKFDDSRWQMMEDYITMQRQLKEANGRAANKDAEHPAGP